eukprot:8210645-Ditylum_brightwellii.AAC.1
MAYVIQDRPSHLGCCEFTPLYHMQGSGGCEFTPLYHMQGSSKNQNFLHHYRTQSDTQQLLQIAVTWDQHQS